MSNWTPTTGRAFAASVRKSTPKPNKRANSGIRDLTGRRIGREQAYAEGIGAAESADERFADALEAKDEWS